MTKFTSFTLIRLWDISSGTPSHIETGSQTKHSYYRELMVSLSSNVL